MILLSRSYLQFWKRSRLELVWQDNRFQFDLVSCAGLFFPKYGCRGCPPCTPLEKIIK